MRALMFGGAFNPPTIAHIDLAKQALDYTHFDKVIFMPTQQTYVLNTQKKDYAFSNQDRLDMLETIAKGNAWMDVSDYEIKEPTQPRTYHTLKYLQSKGIQASLLCGSDKLKELQKWKYVPEIFHEFKVVAMAREEDDIHVLLQTDPYLSQFKDYLTIVPVSSSYQFISSSEVRKAMVTLQENPNDIHAQHILSTYVPTDLEGLKKYL